MRRRSIGHLPAHGRSRIPLWS